MAKIQFREKLRLSKTNMVLLARINEIIDDYARQGYRLTLRQLYYQLVSKDVIPNKQSEYAKLSGLLVKGRMAGVVDWSAIEDRLRVPYLQYWVNDVKHAIKDTIAQYKLYRQKGQDVYIELWVEKDALSGVLKRITDYYHVKLMVNRGYSSCSAMYDAYRRLKPHQDEGKDIVILYLGDHDPSGLDMIRDIDERLQEFGVYPEVKHIGITREQIDIYNPPPNPAKITDPRAKWYIEEMGNTSWEVDALPPKILHELVKKHIEELIDVELFEQQFEFEAMGKQELERLRDLAEEDGDKE